MKKQEKRNFTQSVDLIINQKDFDLKTQLVNIFVTLPHKTSDKKICAFLEKPNRSFDLTVTRLEFPKYQDKKDVKRLVRSYDFFVSLASLMPAVATTFGRYLGPAGKMPSPQLGILANDDERSINAVKEKIEKIIRMKTKEASIKVMIGKENMKDEDLADNAIAAYNAFVAALPKKKENVKSVMLKLTMSKPAKVRKL
ncbi:hypothetical protein HZA33_02450 [Candidatus Pacearchaeota archaeon]|nr:hypothetical protein [Candidatus Pacearchaeota archaeon]